METEADHALIEWVNSQIDLASWLTLDAGARKARLPAVLAQMKELCGVETELAYEMPAGYELAYGLYDPVRGISYLNLDLPGLSATEQLYYLLHEFRHAIQNGRQDLFPPELTEGLRYIIQYDGTAYRQEDGRLLETKLEGEQDYFTQLYLCQHYERDANEFAYRCLSTMSETQKVALDGLDDLYAMWSPTFRIFPESEVDACLRDAYRRIDRQLAL